MADFVMPTLGADMEAGTLVAWRKRPGDRVTRGEIIAEVETDKAAIEVEVFTSGVLDKILVQPGDKVSVGTVLAIIREDVREDGRKDRPAAATLPPPTTGEAPVAPRPAAAPTAPSVPSPVPSAVPASPPDRLRISPAARQRAKELGVDPSALRGTGPEGAITMADVARAKGDTGPSAADRQARMRQTIAAAMARSKREIPHYYLGTTIDVSRAMTWLAETNASLPVTDRILPVVLFVKATALALREVPELNALWQDGKAERREAIHVGVAISLRGGGLVAPALHETDRHDPVELMRRFRDLVTRARAGTLRGSELSDPTVTVTNLGEQGVETVYGVIYPPQVALVGFGKIVERPWVVEGRVTVRSVVTATLSADHRATDGHRGGLLLAAIERLLQRPEAL